MLLLHPHIICYLRNTSLEILVNNSSYTFQFQPEIIQYSEVIDENKFGELLGHFLDQLNLKKSVGIIVLSPKIVFSSEIPLSANDQKNQAQAFFSTVPIKRNQISTVIEKNTDSETLFATNKILYEVIIKIFKLKNVEIYSVFPVSAFFKSSESQEPDIHDFIGKVTHTKKLGKYDFLQSSQPIDEHQTVVPDDQTLKKNTSKKTITQFILLAVSLVFFAGSVMYLLLWSDTIRNPWFKKSDNTPLQATFLPSSSPIATVQPSPTIKPFDKTSVRIQILNGSGIEGQAGEFSLFLKNNGYESVAIGNASDSGKTLSLIYAKHISEDMLKDISDALQIDFADVTVKEASQSAEFDVVVMTGNDR